MPDGVELASDENIEGAEVRVFDVKIVKFELEVHM